MARAAFTNLRPAELAGIGLGLAGLYFAVRPCRDLPAVGADAQTDQAANDAANAARDRAAQSHWPPTEEDVRAIGAVAGAAAGTVFGGPIGGAIGAAIGGFVGGIAYELIDAIPDPSVSPAGQFAVGVIGQAAAARKTVLEQLAQACGTDLETQGKALEAWGAQPLCAPHSDCRRDWSNHVIAYGLDSAYALLNEKQRSFFVAAAAQAAFCETKRHSIDGQDDGGNDGDGGAGVALAATGLGALALWALL